MKLFCEKLRDNGWNVGKVLEANLRNCFLSTTVTTSNSITEQNIWLMLRRSFQCLLKQLEKGSIPTSTSTDTSRKSQQTSSIIYFLLEATQRDVNHISRDVERGLSKKKFSDLDYRSNSIHSSWMRSKYSAWYTEESDKVIKKLHQESNEEKFLESYDIEIQEKIGRVNDTSRNSHKLLEVTPLALLGHEYDMINEYKNNDTFQEGSREGVLRINMDTEINRSSPTSIPSTTSITSTTEVAVAPNGKKETLTTSFPFPDNWLVQLRAERSATERLEVHLRNNVNDEWRSIFLPQDSFPCESPLVSTVSASTSPRHLSSSSLLAELIRKQRSNDEIMFCSRSDGGIRGSNDRKRNCEENKRNLDLISGMGNIVSRPEEVLDTVNYRTSTRSTNKDNEMVLLLKQCREENKIFETILEEEERIRKLFSS